MSTSRLPKPEPIPTRPDEYWVVAVEPHIEAIGPGGFCTHHIKGARFACHSEAVAMTRRGTLLLCDFHLREARMWIEGGSVVSWMLTR